MCHMGSDRKVRPTASRLVGKLRDEWDNVRYSVFKIDCPFQIEVEQTLKVACDPNHIAKYITMCLADFVKCQAYLVAKTEINEAIRKMLILLDEHRTEYVEREGD